MNDGIDYEADRAQVTGRRRTIAGIVAGIIVAAVGAYLLLAGGESEAEGTLELFLERYGDRAYSEAAALTDSDPPIDAADALRANVEGLDGAELTAEVDSFEEEGGEVEATVAYAWDVPGVGRFTYQNPRIRLAETEQGWRVRWRDDVVHPDLDQEGERLGTTREFNERAPILDRQGAELVAPRPVVEIGVIPAELDDVDTAVNAIAAATEVDPKALRRSIEAAESPQNFVPAITLREEEFNRIADQLEPIDGIEFGARELPLAATKEFARAVLGSVGPITAEQLEELGDPYAVGDNVGQSGLQLAYEERLAGTPERAVIIRRADGTPLETLLETKGERGTSLRTTLDADVQDAAELALAGPDAVSALVAVEPSSGDVLAAASRPIDDAFNRGFEGQYPPGSTFKVISTAALLEGGLDPDETVDCPPTIVAGGRSFRNFEHGAAGAVPFRTDFAESCNTAFVSLADRLADADLKRIAIQFGLGEKYELGIPAFSGSVPVSKDETEQAAAMIGQARILASPLAMAGVMAAVVDGRWHSPRLLASDPAAEGPALSTRVLDELRSLMRDVVTDGTGTALAGSPGGPIGKSGTAEYGSGDPPATHAWFIAGREDVAVAVLVEDKPSGGGYAAPIAARFLDALG